MCNFSWVAPALQSSHRPGKPGLVGRLPYLMPRLV